MGLQSPLNLSDEELAAAMQLKCVRLERKNRACHERRRAVLHPTVAYVHLHGSRSRSRHKVFWV